MANEDKDGRKSVALIILMLAYSVMAINAGNISAVYLDISKTFALGVVGLGILTSAFFLAYAIFELPGGFLAARYGPRRVVLTGTAINAIAITASSFSISFFELTIFRFLAGLGLALAYPSILVLIVRLFKKESSGLGISFMTVSNSVGGLVGLFGWAVLSDLVGWRFSLFSGGLLDFAALLILVLSLPRESNQLSQQFHASHLTRIVFNKVLTIMAFANFGVATTVGVVTGFMIFYMESTFGVSPPLAGGVVGMGLAIPLITNPLVGIAYDHTRKRRELFLGVSSTAAASVSVASLNSFPAAIFASIATRPASSGASMVALSIAREVGAVNPAYESATVAWVDSFSLFGQFASAIYFSFLAAEYNYPFAWLIVGGISVMFSLPVLWLGKRVESETLSQDDRNRDVE